MKGLLALDAGGGVARSASLLHLPEHAGQVARGVEPAAAARPGEGVEGGGLLRLVGGFEVHDVLARRRAEHDDVAVLEEDGRVAHQLGLVACRAMRAPKVRKNRSGVGQAGGESREIVQHVQFVSAVPVKGLCGRNASREELGSEVDPRIWVAHQRSGVGQGGRGSEATRCESLNSDALVRSRWVT